MQENNDYDILNNNYNLPIDTTDIIKDNNNLNINLPNLNIYSDINDYYNYDFLTNLELCEDTKVYLASYASSPLRPELNDYTKDYLNSLNDNGSEKKPELSDLTKKYLSQNTENEEKNIGEFNLDDDIKKDEE